MLRTDSGTENGIIATMQCLLGNSMLAHRYGSSIANQRIENWWSTLRRSYTGWVIDFFKSKVVEGKIVTGSILYQEIIWFCFSHLIQKDLDELKTRWNTHRIRKSHNDSVGGIPNELYNLPYQYNHEECGINISEAEMRTKVHNIDDILNRGQTVSADTDVELTNMFKAVMTHERLGWPPRTWGQAEKMLDTLVNFF